MRSSTIAAAGLAAAASATDVPSLSVPACPEQGTITYNKRVPDQTDDFALTQVDLCYTDTTMEFTFTAYNETNFYFDPDQGTNDDIWEYEVMEAFIYKGTDDPQTYFEYEINPNNATFQAFIYNPSEVRAEGEPFDHFFVSNPEDDGFKAETTLDKENEIWVSKATIPLALFNVKKGQAKGTEWRMQFLRTITNEATFPDQELGAWNPPSEANFHITSYMGEVCFV
jgi:hypothetical protein